MSMENRNPHERDHALDDGTSGQLGKECQTYPNSIPIIKKKREPAQKGCEENVEEYQLVMN